MVTNGFLQSYLLTTILCYVKKNIIYDLERGTNFLHGFQSHPVANGI